MGKKIMSKLLSEDDKNAFRDAVKQIKPLPSKNDKVTLRKKKPKPIKRFAPEPTAPSFTISDYQTEATVGADDQLFFVRPGLSPKQIQSLKKGTLSIGASLDLHGCNAEAARDKLIEFIDAKYHANQRYLCIVHGKGHGAEPVLKNRLNNWLRQIEQVLAFASAQPKDGGAGALYVLLRSVVKK